MKNGFVDPKMMQGFNMDFYRFYGGPKDCSGRLYRISFNLYDSVQNDKFPEITFENSP